MKWRPKQLGEVITLKRGHDLPEATRVDGDIPVVSSSGITGHHNVAIAQPPGIVTGRYGTLGEVFFLEEPYWPLNTALYAIDLHGNDPLFCSYFLRTVLRRTQSDKAAVPGVNRNDLHKIQVKVPDSRAQKSIASVLKMYDDLIENNRRRIALLEQAARLLYEEWFVRFRFPGHEHAKFINGMPDGWRLGQVSDFYDTTSGGTPSRKVPKYFDPEIPWVKTQELANEFIVETDEGISEEAIKNSAAKVLPEKTVLLAMYGATVGELGILSMPAACNQACCAILPLDDAAHFIHAFLFFRASKERLRSLSAGSAQRNISQEVIRAFPMLFPLGSILQLFTERLTPTFDLWLNLQKQNRQLMAARDILLPKLMSGEVEV